VVSCFDLLPRVAKAARCRGRIVISAECSPELFPHSAVIKACGSSFDGGACVAQLKKNPASEKGWLLHFADMGIEEVTLRSSNSN